MPKQENSEPLAAHIEAQIDRFVERGIFEHRLKQFQLLRHLLRPSIRKRLQAGVSGNDILNEFYGDIHDGESDVLEAAKKRVQEVRTRLDLYYKSFPDDPVKITIPARSYRALIEPEEPNEVRCVTAVAAAEVAVTTIPTAFKEFFGIREIANQPQGVVILQSDRMDDQFGELIPGLTGDEGLKDNKEQRTLRAHQAITLGSRLYKARHWVNKCDAQGAEAIRSLFWANKIDAPDLVFSRRGTPDPTRPFHIAMGLGFTDRTQRLIEDEEKCGSWLNVNKGKVWGDALYLHEKLLPVSVREQFDAQESEEKVIHLKRLDLYKDADTNEFVRILPHQWKSNYVDLWRKKLDNHNSIDLWDYAVILRHTVEDDDAAPIMFVLAGFTECGTEVAGRYLKANFESLYERFFKGPDTDAVKSLGDFLLIIAGPACPSDDEVKLWRECSDFPAITPKTLHTAGIPCEWSRRFGR